MKRGPRDDYQLPQLIVSPFYYEPKQLKANLQMLAVTSNA